MTTLNVELLEESQSRYLTYALSVVSQRALPDVRDGLKPVQRRILYAMYRDLRLLPEKAHRKSAAVVGEVLARYHPHGDGACYDALVRMVQDFSLRYPLIDGQGNFGSVDGDSAAAYRYTEAKLKPFSILLLSELDKDTVSKRDNFDQTCQEPVVLPARVPNVLVNGSSGIAVGVATNIPPHNLKDVVSALKLLIEDPEVSDSRLISAIKAPDFPTGCKVVNSKKELKEIYTTGKGALCMRGNYKLEELPRGKCQIVITSIPYSVDKSQLVEKIADHIIKRKLPQLEDVRDESTDVTRIVLELAKDADHTAAINFLYKNTPLQQNFNVNLTALVPTADPLVCRPELLGLRQILEQFLEFRVEVLVKSLEFELRKLEERIHLLEGLEIVLDKLDEAIKIVRKSEGRQDGASKLMKRFKLTQIQALFVVDLRIYQLARTAIEEVLSELKDKRKRVSEIQKILKSKKQQNGLILEDLADIISEFGDKRKSEIENETAEVELDTDEYLQHEDVYALVTNDGWVKRIRDTNEVGNTRLRDGDSLKFTLNLSTKDYVVFLTNKGSVFVSRVYDLPSTSGYGEPVQKLFKFQDKEKVIGFIPQTEGEFVVYTERGLGFRFSGDQLSETKKAGRRLVRLANGDTVAGLKKVDGKDFVLVTSGGYGLRIVTDDIPLLNSPAKGVILIKVPNNEQLVAASFQNMILQVEKGKPRELKASALAVWPRARRGNKVIQRAGEVFGE